ncbi:hypothetical protein DXG03_001661 [Asterophora parasitica]|uniref:Uncharacterized protein n=1 Tax=Asterophora parasitica TaxID=117018 RepID=A0A9P7GDZ2_9AGAR|nr:hypothetical protein DXG03_001661 [Asterophora parasitica]
MTSVIASLTAIRPRCTATILLYVHIDFAATVIDGSFNHVKQTLDSEKHRNLTGQQQKTSTPHGASAPGWNEALASESEASVKADQSAPTTTEEMQEQTVEYVTSRYSPDERTTPTAARYCRDEVIGPLGSAAGHEDPQEVYQTVVKRTAKKTTHVVEDEPAQGYS